MGLIPFSIPPRWTSGRTAIAPCSVRWSGFAKEIGEEAILSPYWRFDERYADQIGVGAHGDLPGEIKFQYGAAVLHGSALDQSHYAIYGSLFVLIPEDDPLGTRTFPPFQGNGGGPSGGPLFSLKGEEVDLFMHLTGVRPGSVLETGNTFALVGAVGPTLPAKVAYTVTAPDGSKRTFRGQANENRLLLCARGQLHRRPAGTVHGRSASDLRWADLGRPSHGTLSPGGCVRHGAGPLLGVRGLAAQCAVGG